MERGKLGQPGLQVCERGGVCNPIGKLHLELRQLLEVNAEIGPQNHLHHQRAELSLLGRCEVLEHIILGLAEETEAAERVHVLEDGFVVVLKRGDGE